MEEMMIEEVVITVIICVMVYQRKRHRMVE